MGNFHERLIQTRFHLTEAEAAELFTLFTNRNTPRTYLAPPLHDPQPLSKDGWFYRLLATSPSTLKDFVDKGFLKQKPGDGNWYQFEPVAESMLNDLLLGIK